MNKNPQAFDANTQVRMIKTVGIIDANILPGCVLAINRRARGMVELRTNPRDFRALKLVNFIADGELAGALNGEQMSVDACAFKLVTYIAFAEQLRLSEMRKGNTTWAEKSTGRTLFGNCIEAPNALLAQARELRATTFTQSRLNGPKIVFATVATGAALEDRVSSKAPAELLSKIRAIRKRLQSSYSADDEDGDNDEDDSDEDDDSSDEEMAKRTAKRARGDDKTKKTSKKRKTVTNSAQKSKAERAGGRGRAKRKRANNDEEDEDEEDESEEDDVDDAGGEDGGQEEEEGDEEEEEENEEEEHNTDGQNNDGNGGGGWDWESRAWKNNDGKAYWDSGNKGGNWDGSKEKWETKWEGGWKNAKQDYEWKDGDWEDEEFGAPSQHYCRQPWGTSSSSSGNANRSDWNKDKWDDDKWSGGQTKRSNWEVEKEDWW